MLIERELNFQKKIIKKYFLVYERINQFGRASAFLTTSLMNRNRQNKAEGVE